MHVIRIYSESNASLGVQLMRDVVLCHTAWGDVIFKQKYKYGSEINLFS